MDNEIIIDKGCGLDVHKETVVACVMGSGIKKEIRTFSTKTNDLLRLKVWLSGLANGVKSLLLTIQLR